MIPSYFSAIWVSVTPAMANHLWQSTLFAMLAAILTLALRKNYARVRYRLWLAASIKFLVPLSLLISLGGHLARPRVSESPQNGLYSVVEELSQPFSQAAAPAVAPVEHASSGSYLLPWLQGVLIAVWLFGFVATLSLWWWRWRRLSAAVMRDAVPVSQGREVDTLRRLEQVAGTRTPIVF